MESIATSLTQSLSALGVDRPGGVDEAYTASAEAHRLAFTPPHPVDPATTTAQRVAEDLARYARDESIQKLAQRMNVDFERVANRAARDAFVADNARLRTEITKATHQPLRTVAKFAKHLRPDDTAESVLSRGNESVNAWRDRATLGDAVNKLDAAQNAAELLAVLIGDTRRGKIPARHWWLGDTENPATPDMWNRSGVGRGYLAAHIAGHQLALADVHHAAARQAAEIAADKVERARPKREFEKRQEAKQMERARRELAAHERLLPK